MNYHKLDPIQNKYLNIRKLSYHLSLIFQIYVCGNSEKILLVLHYYKTLWSLAKESTNSRSNEPSINSRKDSSLAYYPYYLFWKGFPSFGRNDNIILKKWKMPL